MARDRIKERFVIRMTDEGMEIASGKRRPVRFTAREALMVLDILQQEEKNLRRIAEEASPLPVRMRFQ